MTISELIKTMRDARNEHGEFPVAIVGQDDGGVYPNDFVRDPIGVWIDEEAKILVVDVDSERMNGERKMDSVTKVIDTFERAMALHGDLRVQVELQDSGGDYGGYTSWDVGVDFNVQKDGEKFYSIG